MLVLALVPADAAAGYDVQTGADGRVSVTIEAPQGHFSEWKPDSIDGIIAFKTTVSTLRLGPYGQYAPMFAQTVRSGDSDLMLKVISPWPGGPFLIKAVLLGKDRQEAVKESMFSAVLNPAMPIDVSMTWASDGTVCLSVKQGRKVETRLENVGGRPTSLALFTSSGMFRFDAVELIPRREGGDPEEQDLAVKRDCVPMS